MEASHARFKSFCSDVTGAHINVSENSRREVRHIMFLKVHKAASSTAQNIFMRFGTKRGLVFMLPKTSFNIISQSGPVSNDNVLRPPEGKVYDVLCCHAIYDNNAIRNFMPRDTVYIGIIRSPYSQFISTINYFRPDEIMNIPGPHKVTTFLRNPTYYVQKSRVGHFLNNRMAYEYNFPRSLFENRNKEEIHKYLSRIDSEFTLVLIADYFDESVVLMRRLLNWNMKDILYSRINRGRFASKVSKHQSLNKLLHRQWAELDYALYDYFTTRLWNQIQSAGSDFHNELVYFKRIRGDVEYFCSKIENINANEMIRFENSPWNERFEITSLDCLYMNIHEEIFLEEIRYHQYGE